MRVSETFFFRTFNWRLTEHETLQHLGKTRSFASWRKCLIRIFHNHLQPLNLPFPFVSSHALHFNTFQGRFECTKSLPSSPCLTMHCSWLASNICGFNSVLSLTPTFSLGALWKKRMLLNIDRRESWEGRVCVGEEVRNEELVFLFLKNTHILRKYTGVIKIHRLGK